MVDALGPKVSAPAPASTGAASTEKTPPPGERLKMPFKDGSTHQVTAYFDNDKGDFGALYREGRGFVGLSDKGGRTFFVRADDAKKIDTDKLDIREARQEAKAEKAAHDQKEAANAARDAAGKLAEKGSKPGETAGKPPVNRFK